MQLLTVHNIYFLLYGLKVRFSPSVLIFRQIFRLLKAKNKTCIMFISKTKHKPTQCTL